MKLCGSIKHGAEVPPGLGIEGSLIRQKAMARTVCDVTMPGHTPQVLSFRVPYCSGQRVGTNAILNSVGRSWPQLSFPVAIIF
jgi:hypothetical protein